MIDETTLAEFNAELKGRFGCCYGMGYLLGKIQDDGVTVEGMHVPNQKSNLLQAELTTEDVAEAYAEIRETGTGVIGLVHYTGEFPAVDGAGTRDGLEKIAKANNLDSAVLIMTNQEGRHQVSTREF